jgi:hypothetical protein
VPRLDLAAGVYTTVDQIRTRCIEQNLSLLWPTTPVWTAQNFAAAWEAIIGHPDLGDTRGTGEGVEVGSVTATRRVSLQPSGSRRIARANAA